jgi:hypothetical protein
VVEVLSGAQPTRKRAQPNCSACGHFVGRTLRVEQFEPLRVTCQMCVWKQARAEQEHRIREAGQPVHLVTDVMLRAAHV